MMIRKATAADIPAIAAIYNALLDREEQGLLTTGWTRGIYPTEQTALDALTAGTLYVLEDEGRVTAAAKIDQHQMPQYAQCPWQYEAPPERVLVVSDDTALAVGRLRIRKGGSAGGHNGLKNIIQHLGTDQFPRVRVGVGEKPHPDYDMADWVLGKFQGEDKKAIDGAVKRAADAVECLLKEGPDRAMNRFNG